LIPVTTPHLSIPNSNEDVAMPTFVAAFERIMLSVPSPVTNVPLGIKL